MQSPQMMMITHLRCLKYIHKNYYCLIYIWFIVQSRVVIKILFLSYLVTDSFVNSQEWTLSRTVPDIRLGIVGSLNSGKSALVHRYLTGSYMQEESPEGGRFKKEVQIDNQSYLLLIRDEGGSPELQVHKYIYLLYCSTLFTAVFFFGNCLLFFFCLSLIFYDFYFFFKQSWLTNYNHQLLTPLIFSV